jgi:phosphate transport system permease protein
MAMQPVVSTRVGRRRKLQDWAFWGAGGVAFILIVAPAISIIVSVVHQALPVLGWSLFTQRTNGIGLQNAILGSLLLLAGVAIIGGSIGISAGVYLAEFATGRSEKVLRFFSEVLAGMPSIVIGYIAYVTLVVSFKWGYSLLAALIALSVLITPYIIKTTEVALRQLPTALREGAAGLGMSRTSTLGRVLVPAALPAIMSGFTVALAISTGELAPLLFTAGFTDRNPSLKLFHQQVPYLTNVIYTDLSLPGKRAHATAAAAGMLSLVILIILIVIARVIAAFSRRKTARMSV